MQKVHQTQGTTRYEYNPFNHQTKVITREGHIQVNRYDAEGLRAEIEENKRSLGVDGVFQFEVHSRYDVMIPAYTDQVLLLMRKIILS